MESRNGRVSLVIAEHGSDCEHWVQSLQQGTAEVVVARQAPGERASAFALRIRGRVAEIEQRGQRVADGILVGGGRSDADALAARSLMIRSVTASMARRGGGRMLLDNHGADRFSMRALATTVSAMVRGTGVAIQHVGDAPNYAEVA